MQKISFRMPPVLGAPPRIDRENGRIFGVSTMQIGEALGHGSWVDDVTLSQIAELGNKSTRGVKVRFTHPGMCSDGLGKMLGRVRNFRVNGDKCLADFEASASAKEDLISHIFDLAENDSDAFGMSVVVLGWVVYKTDIGEVVPEYDPNGMPMVPAGALKDEYGNPMLFLRVDSLRAVDFVDEPAANADGLFSAQTTQQFADWFKGTSNGAAAEAFAVLDQLCEQYQLSDEDVQDFAQRYLLSRSGALPEQTPAAEAAATDKGVHMDLKEVQALSAKHPESAQVILSLAAEGKTEAEILNHVAEVELSNAKEQAASVAAALEAKEKEAVELAEKLADAEKQLADLKALSSVQDPGPEGAKEKVVSKSEFMAMSGKARGEFLAAGGTIDEKGA